MHACVASNQVRQSLKNKLCHSVKVEHESETSSTQQSRLKWINKLTSHWSRLPWANRTHNVINTLCSEVWLEHSGHNKLPCFRIFVCLFGCCLSSGSTNFHPNPYFHSNAPTQSHNKPSKSQSNGPKKLQSAIVEQESNPKCDREWLAKLKRNCRNWTVANSLRDYSLVNCDLYFCT